MVLSKIPGSKIKGRTELLAIEAKAYARAGFLGNPSDGYFGKTISFTIADFSAEVTLDRSEQLRIDAQEQDQNAYDSIEELARNVSLYGYYGAVRLLKAAIMKFHGFCISESITLEEKNFSIRARSSIPRQVGLGGSSAIVTAAMRCLMEFYGIEIPVEMLPSLTLSAEADELGINAGLQDRVIQAYDGCMYMDFDRDLIEKHDRGDYARLDPRRLPPLFLAYKAGLGKVSGHALSDVKKGFDAGDKTVVGALHRIAEIAEEGRAALEEGDLDRLFDLMNENFDQRSRIMKISEGNREMIETARTLGASAKFAGSGGSIIGMYADEAMFETLVEAFKEFDAVVVRPAIV
jgi:glucuronokinase